MWTEIRMFIDTSTEQMVSNPSRRTARHLLCLVLVLVPTLPGWTLSADREIAASLSGVHRLHFRFRLAMNGFVCFSRCSAERLSVPQQLRCCPLPSCVVASSF